MEKTLTLAADPQIPRAVPGFRKDLPARNGTYGNKPSVLEVGNPATRGDPNSPAAVLEEGLHGIIRQSTGSLPENRNLPVLPSVQTVNCAKPNAAIAGRQDGNNCGIRQTLFHRTRGDGEVSKTVESVKGDYPNIALTIFKEPSSEISREAIGPGERVRPSLMHMHEATILSSDPQTAIPIPEQSSRIDLLSCAWNRNRLGFPIN